MADDRRLATHGVVYVAGRVVQIGAYVAVMPLVTRQLTSADYGRVALALVVFQALAAMASFGLTSVVAWSIYEEGAAGVERAQRLLVATTAISASVVVVAHVLGPRWTSVFAVLSYSGPIPLAVWLVLPFTIQAGASTIFQAQHRPVAFVTTTVVTTVGGQCCGLALLAVRGTPAAYLTGVLVGAVAGAVVALVLLPLRTLRPADAAAVRAAFRHGGPTVAHLLGFMVLALADRILIERMIGLEGAARYQTAYVVGSLATVLLYGLNNAWGPMIYADGEDQRWSTLVRSSVQVAWLVALVVVGVAMAAPLGLRILAPASYDLAGLSGVTVLIAAATLFDFVYLASVHVLFVTKRTGALVLVMPVAAAVNVGLNLLLLSRWGLIAAGVSTVAGYMVMAGLAGRASRKVAIVPWDLEALARPLAVILVGLGAALALPDHGPVLALRLAIAVAAAAVLGIGVLRTVRLDPSRESVAAAEPLQPAPG